MTIMRRQSPVQFDAPAIETEFKNGWPVVLKYRMEGDGPYLVDLSHKTRWDVQDRDLSSIRPAGMEIPHFPGDCRFKNNVLVNRMNRTQASVWHLGDTAPPIPDESAYTDVTEGAVHLALFGPNAFFVTEKLTALDILDPAKKLPFLLQGPFAHVPCQIAVIQRKSRADGCILFTCSRGYGQSMIHAVLSAGAEYGLRPCGEERFSSIFL
jgi:hypothetical protein